MKTLMEHIFKVVQARQTPAFAFPFKYHKSIELPSVIYVCLLCAAQLPLTPY